MNEIHPEPAAKISLPLVVEEPGDPDLSPWQGWQPVSNLDFPSDAPEPVEPQGAYTPLDSESLFPMPEATPPPADRRAELLAPAGGPDAAFAAFHFGADAIYLGLKKFSARAEAENFTLDEVNEITAYAHTLQPPRRVFVTINTLIRQDELPELVDALASLAGIGVDALIIQDLGVYHLVREHFPNLELHASTQLAVHNRAGAETLQRLGFRRVVLARELTFEEVRDITATAGIETEVFIHGALCYSYSGLCLFSSQTLGRSGNRGKCSYSCRDSFEVTGAPLTLRDGAPVHRDPTQGFPFSMKDLALPDHIPALRAAGVSCFKVEGRKKSPLYVATTTNYYRRLLDGTLQSEDRPDLEAELQTVFSRPWTRLFLQSHKNKEVADRDTVGHRGTLVGHVETVHGSPNPRLRFQTDRPIELHDGLQIDLPILGKPFGFAVDRLWILSKQQKTQKHEAFEAPAGSWVEVPLPQDHPDLPHGAPVYCSSSQAVKNKYRHSRPKPGLFRMRHALTVEATLTTRELTVVGRLQSPSDSPVEARQTLSGPFSSARDPDAMRKTLQGTFDRLGDTPFTLAALSLENQENLFVPVSHLNQLRRELVADLERCLARRHKQQAKKLRAEVLPTFPAPPGTASFQWSLKVDRLGFLDAFEDADLSGIEECIVDITRDHPTMLQKNLQLLAERIGKDRIRLALPPLTRSWEDKPLRHKITGLLAAGWTKWEAANLSAWSYLALDPNVPVPSPFDLATDWSIYVINRLAARELLDRGVTRFTLSPEDGFANIRSLLAEFGSRAVLIVHQDTPLFLAESCAYANLIGGCPGKANCRFESMEMVSSHGEKVTALDYHCRTIVLNQEPFCLSTRLDDLAHAGAISLRADFIYRAYQPHEVRERWRLLRAGRAVSNGQSANFDRGVL